MGRSEDLLVGLIAVALLPMIAWRIRRGLREGRLPLYRTYVERAEAGSKFGLLLALHALSFVIVAAIAADLLFQLGLKEAF
ncbi:MAG TPA: hypothetical protein VD846_02350 [Allosphingosinicella sp.]|nr:hypothetical protein [Allosphingosinicella sp.]